MKKLPVGYQEFREIREGGFLYVDKTEHLCRLAQTGKHYFLSRPRRFGKTLTVSTLTELFQGSQELFEGLWAESNWDWSETSPVVRLFFNSASYQIKGLDRYLTDMLQAEAERFGLSLSSDNYPDQLQELVEKVYEQAGKVALFVDEYDKPILDFLDDVPQAEGHRQTLKRLYSVLKPLDSKLRMIFLTGVSKFSRASIFSELNNLEDLSRAAYFQPAVGITQAELERDFSEHIESLAAKRGESRAETLSEIKEWYNGYAWGDLESRVYNPFSLLNLFRQQSFENFWFESGTPTFLSKALRERGLYELSGLPVSSEAFESFEPGDLSAETLLFQSGYVTIKSKDEFGLYELGYPNREVRSSMLRLLVASYTGVSKPSASAPVLRMAKAVRQGDLSGLKDQFNALLSGIPYDLHQKQEAYYHTVIYLAFQLVGLHVKAEVHSAKGRLDAVVEEGDQVYVFEFKVDGSAEAALEQIKELGYAKPYLGTGKEVSAIAVNFSTESKEVDGWLVKRLD